MRSIAQFKVSSTPEEFKNGDFTLTTHQMFPVHTTPEGVYNAFPS